MSSVQVTLLAPFLSLKQVKSLTLARNPYQLCPPDHNDFECEAVPGFAPARFHHGVLPIDLLVIDLRGRPSLEDGLRLETTLLTDTRYTLDRWNFLALFNPKQLRVLGNPLSSQVSDDARARKALDAYRISAGQCDPNLTLSLDLLPWSQLEHVTCINTMCHNLAYLKVPTVGQKRVNVILDVSRQDLVQMPDSSVRWSREPRTPVSKTATHSAVTSALSTIKAELRAQRLDEHRDDPGAHPFRRWHNTSLLGHVTVLVANEEQVQEAEALTSWHGRTNISQRKNADFRDLIWSKAVQCVCVRCLEF